MLPTEAGLRDAGLRTPLAFPLSEPSVPILFSGAEMPIAEGPSLIAGLGPVPGQECSGCCCRAEGGLPGGFCRTVWHGSGSGWLGWQDGGAGQLADLALGPTGTGRAGRAWGLGTAHTAGRQGPVSVQITV